MPRWLLPLLSGLFLLSGAAALIYQVMWLRMLSLVFGVTVYAASTVLASFMAGLAIGSFAGGRIAGRLRHPLTAFGLLEIGIGLSALATPVLLDAVRAIWILLQPSLPSSIVFLTAARFAASFAILIVPTSLMGATLPIVMRSALMRDAATAGRIGLLYAINTGGAIAGALIAGFYLLAEHGMAQSFQAAALINVAVGATALLASRAFAKRAQHQGASRVDADAAALAAAGGGDARAVNAPIGAWQRQAVVWTFFLSGLMSLALEIVWFRMLVAMLRPTAYAFTIMLIAVLAGIALGSAAAAPFLRRSRAWLPALTVVQLAIALAAVLSLNALWRTQQALSWISPLLTRFGIDASLGLPVAASLLAILPTTLLLGFAFPIGLSLFAGIGSDAARRIGAFYSLNVCGAIAGSLLGGFVLLPVFGSRGSLIATSAAALLSSVMLAASQWRVRPNFAGFMAIVGPVAFVMAALNAVDPHAITARDDERVMWREEGVQTTVAVHESIGARPTRVMYLDGMHQASDAAAG